MTREQAIQEALDDAILYHELQAKSLQEAIGKTNHPRAVELYEDAKRYNENALTALREALKRRQGCEYCEKEKRIKNACYTNAFAEIYKYSKSFAVHMPLNFGSADCDFFINYCPMCGRKLEVEG